MKKFALILVPALILSCTKPNNNQSNQTGIISDTIAVSDTQQPFPAKVCEIPLPKGFSRDASIIMPATGWANYLRNLPLKPQGTPVYLYNGEISGLTDIAYAVIDSIDTGTRDLQQCADAIIRLQAEYLYAECKAIGDNFDIIAFHLTNGFLCEYKKWAEGYRVKVEGNKTTWYKAYEKTDYSYGTFRKYLDFVFNYAGTQSLIRETTPMDICFVAVGDLFIHAGSPGHAMIIVDAAMSDDDKIFLVAESFMPAQDIHIVINENNPELSPWYSLKDILKEDKVKFPTYYYNLDEYRRYGYEREKEHNSR